MLGIHINRFLGFSLCFPNGFSIGWNWVHGNGETSKTSAIIAGYHHPKSITWRWALYYSPPKLRHGWRLLNFKYCGGLRYRSIALGPLGCFFWNWQDHMFRNDAQRPELTGAVRRPVQ